jgi:DNA-binding MarR family transcriptional regulator
MSSAGTRKAELIRTLSLEIRRMSAQSVLVSSAVAERVGLSSSDLECLDFIVTAASGALTPGELAAAVGLTSGAITGVVDRLESAGYVRREADASDRRKVRLVAVESRVRQAGIYYERLGQRMEALWAQMTESQLRSVLDFSRRTLELSAKELAHIRTLPPLKPVKVSRATQSVPGSSAGK